MKQTLRVLSTGLIALGAITFVGCSQEDAFWFDDDLSINSQVPLTRGESEQTLGTINYNLFSYGENECCLIALVEMKGKKREFDATYSAQSCYNDIKEYATSLMDEDGNPRYEGGAMDLEVFLEVGRNFNLINERKHFNNDEEKMEYFLDKKCKPQAINIDVWNEEKKIMESHVARVESVKRKSGTIEYSVRNGKKLTMAEIDIKEIKDVWM
ncbi:MAG: hypothetical protein K2J00_05445 [Bacteroidaceae bacterium]|nr:hypothetical protein [Bacteroidaceae bacterium]